MRRQIETALVQEALTMAWGRRRPAAGLLHPSERGRQYASHASRDCLSAHGMVCSMRDQGAWLDHAVAERFVGSFKRAWTSHGEYATRQEAKAEISAYIEMFSHSKRQHSYLGYVRPNDYEKFSLVA